MDSLIKTIQENRDIRPSTVNIYKSNLNKLAKALTDDEFKSVNFLTDVDKVLDYLKDKSNSVKRKFISTILIALSPKKKNDPIDKYEDAYNKYKNILNNENTEYLDKIKNNNKSEKDLNNWIQWSEILKVPERLLKQMRGREIKLNKAGVKNLKDFQLVQDYIISLLYTQLPPRRLEYADAEFISKSDFDKLNSKEKDNNIYLVNEKANKKFFSFGKNKVKSETLDNVKVDIPKSMNTILNFWIKTNKSTNLLVNNKGEKLNKNALGKRITEIFKSTGKNISVVLLRKIYLSDKYGELLQERKKTAEEMNHSLNTSNTFYIKK